MNKLDLTPYLMTFIWRLGNWQAEPKIVSEADHIKTAMSYQIIRFCLSIVFLIIFVIYSGVLLLTIQVPPYMWFLWWIFVLIHAVEQLFSVFEFFVERQRLLILFANANIRVATAKVTVKPKRK